MEILTIQKDESVKINIKKIIKNNPTIDILVINYGDVAKLEQYNIDYAIAIFVPLVTISKEVIVIEARFSYFFDGEVNDIQYTTTIKTFQFKRPFWVTKKYMLRTVFHYAMNVYLENEILIYDTSFKQEIWKFYDYINNEEVYKQIFAKDGPKSFKVTKTQAELGFYEAIRNPYYIHPPEPDNCKLCKFYAKSSYLHCTVNPSLRELCRDYVRA
jgi:hypothetical protein